MYGFVECLEVDEPEETEAELLTEIDGGDIN